jgi:soluble lytic murein transglycosylase
VPATLHGDASFLFARAQSLRRQGKAAEAAALIRPLPRDPAVLIDGDAWWVERRLIARQLLDQEQAALAYEVARDHSAEKPSSIIEAEWHAGWIALRFLNQPATALQHFEAASRQAETPISLARTAYWRGMALEAMGETARSEAALADAARQSVAFYGQLARARLGQRDIGLAEIHKAALAPQAGPPHPALDAAAALQAAGARSAARPLLMELAREVEQPADLTRLAALATAHEDASLLVSLGKAVIQRGLPFAHIAYPAEGLTDFDLPGDAAPPSVERAMLFAIARQESAFDRDAVSHAGARGLMQLMPATARETARRIGLPFDTARLTRDGAYNARLGAAHLADLAQEWRGSYVLMFAAYNAGSGNVRKWIEAYGDPRDGRTDVVDWVERIPFTETRNYVQRVMENLQVYRARLHGAPALLVAQDLRRGQRLARFAGEGCVTVALAAMRTAAP